MRLKRINPTEIDQNLQIFSTNSKLVPERFNQLNCLQQYRGARKGKLHTAASQLKPKPTTAFDLKAL